jgi:hypothetical protein
MGMFDWYRPTGDLKCPACGRPLTTWQGKDGPRALFVWQQGEAAPVAQEADDDVQLAKGERQGIRLPSRFTIYSYDCPDHHPVDADCVCVGEVWATTSITPVR